MIATLTCNPSLDYIIEVKDFQTGKLNRVEKETIHPGGKGINVSIVLSNLGLETKIIAFAAGFTGEALNSLLEDTGIQTDMIWCESGLTRINVKMKSGNETEINGRGPAVGTKALARLYESLDGLTAGDILVLSGSVPKSLPDTLYQDIASYAVKKGIRIVIDAEGPLLLATLAHHPFLIKPNKKELGWMFDTEIKSLEECVEYSGKLQGKGARNVLVSLGQEGAVLLDETGNALYSPAVGGKAVYSIGAGDSMVAGFLAGYEKTKDYKTALSCGNCAGSGSAMSGQLVTLPLMKKMWDQMNLAEPFPL